jgi:hypothetical protein
MDMNFPEGHREETPEGKPFLLFNALNSSLLRGRLEVEGTNS